VIETSPQYHQAYAEAEHTFYPNGIPPYANRERVHYRIAAAALDQLRLRGLFDGDTRSTARQLVGIA
jgi:hypothetical protein